MKEERGEARRKERYLTVELVLFRSRRDSKVDLRFPAFMDAS